MDGIDFLGESWNGSFSQFLFSLFFLLCCFSSNNLLFVFFITSLFSSANCFLKEANFSSKSLLIFLICSYLASFCFLISVLLSRNSSLLEIMVLLDSLMASNFLNGFELSLDLFVMSSRQFLFQFSNLGFVLINQFLSFSIDPKSLRNLRNDDISLTNLLSSANFKLPASINPSK